MTSLPDTVAAPLATTDFYELRRAGIERIEAASSARWTDYNLHDPGITILEAVAYAITELGYRTGLPIADLVASSLDDETAVADQAFYSPRTILTVNPTTPADLRRRLIDVAEVRNAWVLCKSCACDAPYFAWCDDDHLVLAHDPAERPDHVTDAVRVEPRGLIDLLVELEADPDLGDLNDRRIVRRRTVVDADGRRHLATVEARFPDWPLARLDDRRRLAADDEPFALTLHGPNRTTTGTTPVDDEELRRHWFDVFYVDVDVELADATVVTLDNVAVRLFGDAAVRDGTTVADLLDWLGDTTAGGFVGPYRSKLGVIDVAIDAVRAVFHTNRNLDEDVCRVEQVGIVDVAVCADVEVEPAADIERVQAQIWFEVERYVDPPIEFRSLGELLADGRPVEAIFDGPELAHGFITDESLEASELRSELRVSDLLDRLVDIDGVLSVERVQLTAYGADGTPIAGISDPTRSGTALVFDPARISASWSTHLPAQHRARLHRELSRFSFESDGLPFLPRLDEAEDTLVQLHAQAARPKLLATDLDLPLPLGRPRDLTSYRPVQHDFPEVYGIGPVGLPTTASPARRAQATQLKAYLMVFDQLLRNAHEQVARFGDLFSLDAAVDRTYFSTPLSADEVAGYDDVVDGLDAAALAALVETPAEFVDRRNRFLDHLLARFGESFRDFAVVLAGVQGSASARADIIPAKLAFLRALPGLGHDRGRAFDRTTGECDPANRSGLERRIALLLGLPEVTLAYAATADAAPPGYRHDLTLDATHPLRLTPPPPVAVAVEALIAELGLVADDGWSLEAGDGAVRLQVVEPPVEPGGQPIVVVTSLDASTGAAGALASALAETHRAVLATLTRRDRLEVAPVDPADAAAGWRIELAADAILVGSVDGAFPTESDARAAAEAISAAAAHARSVVVEHLLLRPKFPGDALFPACSDAGCCTCGDEDPYSFRLTYVAPGWTAPFNTDTRLRAFADRVVREQTPAHLLPKACWVGNDGFVADPCDPLIDRLADVLEQHTADREAACTCAAEVVDRFGAAFGEWLDTHAVDHLPAGVLQAQLTELLGDVDLTGVACAAAIDDALRTELTAEAVDGFAGIARHGYQFERFADAWCRWLAADAEIDWDAERLQETVTELVGDALVDGAVADHAARCACAAAILARFGTAFREWMLENIGAGRQPGGFTPFAAPGLAGCSLPLDPGALNDLRVVLAARYARYAEVSYRLQVLVDVLADLRNTHPRATLHDCDEGSDFNPVRLGQTALGRN